MIESRAFKVDKFRQEYWVFKGIIDLILLVFALVAVVISINNLANNSFDSEIDEFKIFVYIFSSLLLTAALVTSTELAWSVRKGVMDGGVIKYVQGTEMLTINDFEGLLCNSSSPVYFRRVFTCLLSGPYFVLLFIEMLCGCSNDSSLWKQWVCFAPSILLSWALYALLAVLVLESQSILDIFFVIVGLQIYSGLSNRLITIVFNREKSAGHLMTNFTVAADGISKMVIFMMGQLVDTASLHIDFRGLYREITVPELLSMVIECVSLLRKDCVITLSNIKRNNEVQEQIQEFIELIDAFNDGKPYHVTVEMPQLDFDRVEGEYALLRVTP